MRSYRESKKKVIIYMYYLHNSEMAWNAFKCILFIFLKTEHEKRYSIWFEKIETFYYDTFLGSLKS